YSFFFSSRRRHTRFSRDWSSDVCSSDLVDDTSALPDEPGARREWLARQQGVLELTHNHGTEDDPGAVYHDGNSDPRGFGHICVRSEERRGGKKIDPGVRGSA